MLCDRGWSASLYCFGGEKAVHDWIILPQSLLLFCKYICIKLQSWTMCWIILLRWNFFKLGFTFSKNKIEKSILFKWKWYTPLFFFKIYFVALGFYCYTLSIVTYFKPVYLVIISLTNSLGSRTDWKMSNCYSNDNNTFLPMKIHLKILLSARVWVTECIWFVMQ